MLLNDLFHIRNIDPKTVLVLRHRPKESELRKALPWLASEHPELFNAYQQTQGARLEKSITRASYIASFIGHSPGKALFVGLYSIGGTTPMTIEKFRKNKLNKELLNYRMTGFVPKEDRKTILWFDLILTDFYSEWKGKLVVKWPGLERSWWRWSDRNEIPVLAITEDNLLTPLMPPWNEIELSWPELGIIPTTWKAALQQWRGIYYIFDSSDGKAYVGSAYGKDNILGRWREYAKSGHGGNHHLRKRDPSNFIFTILERVSPDMESNAVIEQEVNWKQRLHTRYPFGLNEN
jgi:hypothetical protein